MCNIIATGSSGNAVQVDGSLLLDCGVPFKALSGCFRDLKLILLTHVHSDHFNRATIKRLSGERPTVRFGCCEWLVEPLVACGVRPQNIDVYEPLETYSYGDISVSPVPLVHCVPNGGYKLKMAGKRILYATDTGSLDGIEAKGYDLYLIEANHTEQDIQERMERKLASGEFCYEYRAAVDHLSKEKADAFLAENAAVGSRYIYLHQHKEREAC